MPIPNVTSYKSDNTSEKTSTYFTKYIILISPISDV